MEQQSLLHHKCGLATLIWLLNYSNGISQKNLVVLASLESSYLLHFASCLKIFYARAQNEQDTKEGLVLLLNLDECPARRGVEIRDGVAKSPQQLHA